MMRAHLGSFVVEDKIASGGMGDVWRGSHSVQGIPVAIKVIRIDGAEGSDFSAGFRREVRAVARLEHPAIVPIFDIGEVDARAEAASAGALEVGSPYLVMQYLKRGSVESLEYPLPWTQTKALLLAVLDGLAHAHARGITHRDLKPGNILIANELSECPVHLTDFGIAFSYEERRTAETAGPAIGTPPYMAPEQFMGEWREFGPWTDLYALGCVAYQLTCGHVPFRHRDIVQLATAHMDNEPPELICPPDYPPAFSDWVMQLLRKSTTKRFRRCADAAVALASLTTTPSGHRSSARENGGTTTPRSFLLANLGPGNAKAHATGNSFKHSFDMVGAGQRLFAFRNVPFVGRSSERDVLWSLFERVAADATPSVAVLEGPAGFGKSRLAEWFFERVHEMGFADRLKVEHDRFREREFGLSYMVADAWSCLGTTAAELQYRVATILRRADITAQTAINAATELLAAAALGDEYTPGSFFDFPSRSARFSVLFNVLRRVYHNKPLVVWLDDVHWSTEALEFVLYMLKRTQSESMRIMVVLTVRDDLAIQSPEVSRLMQELNAKQNATLLRIEALEDVEMRRLVNNLLYLQGDLAQQVLSRSGGNPLYATQLVRDWINRGILEPGASGFVLSGHGDAVVPDDVHAVWVGRLERVIDECTARVTRPGTLAVQRIEIQMALELAAALGAKVDTNEWTVVCSLVGVADPKPVLESLLGLRMARGHPKAWAFSHTMLRDTVERIAKEKRRWSSHNRFCARMLQQKRPIPHWGDSERIGRHHFEARQFEAALGALLRGARERKRMEEYAAAHNLLALYERALDGIEATDNDARRLEGWLLRAEIYLTRGDLRDAEDVARRVRANARAIGDERFDAAAVLVLARVHEHQGDLALALSEFVEAQGKLRVAGRKQDLARCLSEMARATLDMGLLDRAWRAVKEAQAIFEDLGHFVPWVENQVVVSRIAFQQGDLQRAIIACERARKFASREHLQRIEASAFLLRAEIEMSQQQYNDAEDSLHKSITLFEQLGLARQTFRPRAFRGLLALENGNLRQAKSEFELFRARPETDVPRIPRLLMQGLGLALSADGEDAEFRSRLEEASTGIGEAQQLPTVIVRCLELASERASEKGLTDRTNLIRHLSPA